jgi:D-lactate dehydrogenase
VGVVGTGKIGAAFCEIMLGFGCKVAAFDVHINKELESKGVKYLPLPELLRQSDIVSLHCPLTDQTKQLINRNTIQTMKRGAMLINTSRGGLLDTRAAVHALKTGQLGYLGIDVYEQEEQLFFYNWSEEVIQDELILRLMTFPNVLITSHQGFFTDEALTEIATTTIQNITDFESGRELENLVA